VRAELESLDEDVAHTEAEAEQRIRHIFKR
jgi:hypothetical protein